jgi:O-antigen/teichoic acid export membrane protein
MPFKDSFIYILSKLLPSGLAFATGIGLAWLLSPADYGVYGYGMAVAMVIGTVGFDWLGLSYLRFKPKHGTEPGFAPTVVAVFFGLCVASLMLMAIIAATMPADRALLLMVCTAGAWAYAYFEMAGRTAVGDFKSVRYFWMNMARNAGVLAAGLGLAWVFQSPLLVLAGGFAAMLAAGLAFWRAPVRFGVFDRSLARRLFKYGMPMMATMTLYAVLTNVNRLLLDGLSGPEEVGYFTAAATLAASTISVLANGVGTATYSAAVRQVERGETVALQAQMKRNAILLTGLLLPATVGFSMLAGPIAELCLSREYELHVTAMLPWIAVGSAIQAFRSNYIDFGFQLGNRTGLQVWSYVAPAIVNVALNVLLIPSLGGLGSAMAMTAAHVLALGLSVVMVERAFHIPYPLTEMAKAAGATAIMAAAIWPMMHAHGPLPLVAAVVLGIAAYAAGAVIFNLLDCRSLLAGRLGRLVARGKS